MPPERRDLYNKQFELYLFGHKSICPKCSGLLTSTGDMKYHCIDCKTNFFVVDMGPSDDKVICEKEDVNANIMEV